MVSYQKLRVLMAEKNIDWKTLRIALDLNPKTIKRLKSSDYVDLKTLEKICLFFNVNIGEIMDIIDMPFL